MGVELEPPTIRRCANRCEFCFIEGLPKGLRKPLYVRDDDYRLSFAYGNFATLSNLKDRDIARILEYRLSPLYISVHATPWEARKVLLNNPRVPNIVEQLTKLAEGGIQFHGQMVIVPGLNDGDVLEESFRDLWSFGDAVLSVAIVPVGLTQFSHLYTGKSMDRETARDAPRRSSIDGPIARATSADTRGSTARTSCICSPNARCPTPTTTPTSRRSRTASVPSRRCARACARDSQSLPRLDGRRIGVVTGVSMAGIMPELLEQLERRNRCALRADRHRELAVRADDDDRRAARSAPTSAARSPIATTSISR